MSLSFNYLLGLSNVVVFNSLCGSLDKASATTLVFLGAYFISKSNSWSNSIHRAYRRDSVDYELMNLNDEWSVTIVNFTPSR